MRVDFDNITRNFILNEVKEPELLEYLSVISEMLGSFKPMRESDKGRLSVMQENLRKAKRQARMMQERLSILEEQVKIIEETKKKIKTKEDSLTPEERSDYQKANVYVMEFEGDGGKLPDWIEKQTQAEYEETVFEKRKLIKWFHANAPGDY